MSGDVIVIGAGIIGAAIARELSLQGRAVLLIDKSLPAQGASGRSFGWINASFYHDERHHRFRAEAIASWRELAGRLGKIIRFSGAVAWDVDAGEQREIAAELESLGYPVRQITERIFSGLLPEIGTPVQNSLHFATEAAVDAELATKWLMKDAASCGMRFLSGLSVLGVTSEAGAVTGVQTETGHLAAGNVVVAAGVATQELLSPLGVSLPMLRRPGMILTTRPVKPLCAPVLVTPFGEVRQDEAGRIIASTVAGHQGDSADRVEGSPETHGLATLEHLKELFPHVDLALESVSLALRPVPEDGLPAIGWAGPKGLYVATMHRGVTLAPLVGKLVAQELSGQTATLLGRYRPTRF